MFLQLMDENTRNILFFLRFRVLRWNYKHGQGRGYKRYFTKSLCACVCVSLWKRDGESEAGVTER